MLVLNQQFNLRLFNVTLVENRYLFLLAQPPAAAGLPWHPKAARSPLWLGIDIALCIIAMGALFRLGWKAEAILGEGWAFSAPAAAKSSAPCSVRLNSARLQRDNSALPQRPAAR